MWHEKDTNNVVANVRLHSRIYCVKGCNGKPASEAVMTMSCQGAHSANVCGVYTQLLTQPNLQLLIPCSFPNRFCFSCNRIQPTSIYLYAVATKYS